MQTKSPGALTLPFRMEDGFALDFQELFFGTANKQEGQTNFQSLKALNFSGREPFSTKRFIARCGR